MCMTRIHGVQHTRMISVVFRIFNIIILCFVVAMWDVMHDLVTIFHLFYVLTASENLFGNMSEANCSFTGITHISEKISRCC